jgi:hypothetical protein
VRCPWALEQLLEYRAIIRSWIGAQGDGYNPGHGGIAEQSLAALMSTGLTFDEALAVLREPDMDDSGMRNKAIGAHVLWGCVRVQLAVTAEGMAWGKPMKGITYDGLREREEVSDDT